jgi:hypothetical protein
LADKQIKNLRMGEGKSLANVKFYLAYLVKFSSFLCVPLTEWGKGRVLLMFALVFLGCFWIGIFIFFGCSCWPDE